MKITHLLFGALLLWTIILSSTTIQEDSLSQIGNVVYSVLPPNDFKKQNGNGWVLLDGESHPNSTLAHLENGMTKVPDARGTFIRVIDTQRGENRRDKYRNFGAPVGDYQIDRTRIPDYVILTDETHSHSMKQIARAFVAGNQRADGEEYSTPAMLGGGNYRFPSTDPSTHTHNITGSDSETAPKNIILYAYIKIN